MVHAMFSEYALDAQDTAVICAYLASVLIIGGALAMIRLRRVGGAQTPEQYFLGGRSLPWWALAVADLSSYLDISGTMINTALLYALGMQGFYVEIRGGVCLMLAFQLAFTGKLSRRSMMITKAEWMRFRFGDDRNGRAARLATAIVAVVNALLLVCYFAVGGGKFATTFVRVPSFGGIRGEFWAAAFLMLVAAIYTVAAGFWSIVWTDVYQSVFIFFAFVYVGVRGIAEAPQLPSQLVVHVPLRNGSFVPVHYMREHWLSIWPSRRLDDTLPPDAEYAIYDIYWLAIAFYLLKTSVQSLGGPSGGGLQTVLAQRSDVAVARQTLLAACLMALRWLFSAALAVLAASHFVGINVIDPERVLPDALAALPSGFRGLVLSALLAAGLTTFDTTINAASSYCTLDIYHTFVHPGASKQRLFGVALVSSVAVMLGGLLISLRISTINSVWGSVMMGLGGCQSWPAFLAWYWERTNGLGFAAGIACGLVAFLLQLVLVPDWPEYSAFCLSSVCSFGATVAVSLRTAPTPTRVLGTFFRRTRPPGLWASVVEQEVPGGKGSRFMKEVRRENYRDILSLVLAVPWQIFLYLMMVCVITRNWTQLVVCASLTGILSVCLYYMWYRRMVRQDRDSKARGDSALLTTILKRDSGEATDGNNRKERHSGVAAAQNMIESVDLTKRSEAERWEAYAELDHALYARLLDESPRLRGDMRTSAALEEGDDDDDEKVGDEFTGTGTLERERSERARFGWGLLGSWRWSIYGSSEAAESRPSSCDRRRRRRRSDWQSGSGTWSFGSADSGGLTPTPAGSPLLSNSNSNDSTW